jgi:heat shock protein HspQ
MRALLAQAEAQEASQHAPATPGRPRPANVLYRAGDVVRHREYGYRAVVYEWDPSCQADSNWQNATSVQLLPNGGSQPFYR